MSFSTIRRFDPVQLLGWIRSEANERYAPKPANPQHDPWWSMDMDYATAWAGAPGVNW